MSNPYTGTVASALRKAELLLAAGGDTALQRAAQQEAAVLQLWRAYRAFLAELAYLLQLGQGVEPESPQALDERARSQGKYCAAAVEMCELDRGDGWLAQLQSAWVALWRFAGESPRGGSAAQLIPLQDLSVAAELSDSQLREWHRALVELVQRHRAQAQEF
ncbi:DUF6586 family protein [Microbulbifer sp. SAOS-129_SWC]|uniref:DUF6586 family protein n=1 Tax=Microbulbifer sp. SAOS-129_SWC TaxID=3145235 RepID=UPI003217985C